MKNELLRLDGETQSAFQLGFPEWAIATDPGCHDLARFQLQRDVPVPSKSTHI
jgi:hypothetical protein